jgi:hypothetical protein
VIGDLDVSLALRAVDLFGDRDQTRQLHLERTGDAYQRGQRGIAYSTLDIADVGAVQERLGGQLLLGPLSLATDPTHCQTNGLGHLHLEMTLGLCRLSVYRL